MTPQPSPLIVDRSTLEHVAGLALLTHDRTDEEQRSLRALCARLGSEYIREADETWEHSE